MQPIIAEVNHAIGATGVVSQECKAIVAEYGETIIKMLLAKVYASFSGLLYYSLYLCIANRISFLIVALCNIYLL